MKILGGLSKTGTTSLTAALRQMGLSAKHFPGSVAEANSCDALTDSPVFMWLEAIDSQWGAKFVFTTRNLDGWLISCERQFRQDRDLSYLPQALREYVLFVRQQVFGASFFDERLWRQAYAWHLDRLQEYYRDRPHDLLIFDIDASDGEKWERLGKFIDRTPPDAPFPRLNRSALENRL